MRFQIDGFVVNALVPVASFLSSTYMRKVILRDPEGVARAIMQ